MDEIVFMKVQVQVLRLHRLSLGFHAFLFALAFSLI